MTTFAKFSSVFMFYREQSNQNVIGTQTFLVYGMSGSFWQACALFRCFWALREEKTPKWGMRNPLIWNVLIIVQVDKVSSIFKVLSQEE